MERVFFILISLLYMACSANQIESDLSMIDDLLLMENNDSASKILDGIVVTDLESDEQIAHYNLIKTEIAIRNNVPIGDSLINRSISYYIKGGNDVKLANSYYYKGLVVFDHGMWDSSAYYYKMAEQLSEKNDDHELGFKVYWALAALNGSLGDKHLSIYYSKKQLEESIHLSDSARATALLLVAFSYHVANNNDSAINVLQKLSGLEDCIYSYHKPYYYNLLGELSMDSNPDKAMYYFQHSAKLGYTQEAYANMAILYNNNNQPELAREMIRRTMDSSCYEIQIDLLNMQCNMMQEAGDYVSALDFARQASVVKDSLALRNQQSKIVAMQKELEYREREFRQRRIIGIGVSAFLILILLTLLLIYVKIHQNDVLKAEIQANENEAVKMRNLIDSYSHQTLKLKAEIDELRKNGEPMDSNKITTIENKLYALETVKRERIDNGKRLLESLLAGGNTIQWETAHFNDVMEYYVFKNPNYWISLTEEYEDVSPKNFLFLLLFHLSISENDVARIFCIKESSVKSKLSRLRTKKKL